MCVLRRGVCPDCAIGNAYLQRCAMYLLDPTDKNHDTQLWSLQRGGALACQDHRGIDCKVATATQATDKEDNDEADGRVAWAKIEWKPVRW